MEKFKVSVIIPVFNAQKFLNNCLNTFKEQTIGFNNIELIFVNDCSTDNTKKILEEFSAKYSNCKIFNLKENSGCPSIPLNIGIEQVTSDFLMFMDQDDTYAENMCEVLYGTIVKSEVDFVMCNHDTLINGKSIIMKGKENFEETFYNPKKDLEIFKKGYRWDKIFNMSFIKNFNIKNPDSNVLAEDIAFSVNAYLNTNKIIYLKNFYGYNYNIRESLNKSLSNTVTENMIEKNLKGYYYIAKLVKDKNRYDVMSILFEGELKTLLIFFVKLDAKNSEKIKILNKIYSFEEYLNTPIKFSEKWAAILNSFIIKRQFKIAVLLSKLIKLVYNLPMIKKIHRNQMQKKLI